MGLHLHLFLLARRAPLHLRSPTHALTGTHLFQPPQYQKKHLSNRQHTLPTSTIPAYLCRRCPQTSFFPSGFEHNFIRLGTQVHSNTTKPPLPSSTPSGTLLLAPARRNLLGTPPPARAHRAASSHPEEFLMPTQPFQPLHSSGLAYV